MPLRTLIIVCLVFLFPPCHHQGLVRGFSGVSQAVDYHVVGHVNSQQRIQLRSSIAIPDGAELGLPIIVEENAIRLNGSASAKITAIWSPTPDGIYGAGEQASIPIFVEFTSPVIVKGKPDVLVNTGCHEDGCTTKEVQSFTCFADNGAFALSFNGGVVPNIPTDASRDMLKYAIESLPGIEEVTVAYGDDDEREYSHGDRVCSSRGNNVTVTFDRWSFLGTDGDLPLLGTDWLNAPPDGRTFQSGGDGSFLTGRFPDSHVKLTQPVELVKGRRMDDGRAPYASGNGTSTLQFLYTVRPNDLTAALETVALSFTPVSAILTAQTGEPVDFKFPKPGQNVSVLFSSAKSLSFDRTIAINTEPAKVIDVTTTNEDGEYTSGDVLQVAVTFNVPVVVEYGPANGDSPIPFMYLNTGGVGGKAFASAVDGARVFFRYRIKEGDSAKQVDYFDIDSLMLGNGTISTKSASPSTPAMVTLPLPATPGSISYSRNIKVDTTRPYILNVSSPLSSGIYGAGEEVDITVLFNKEVVVSGSPVLLLQTGSTYLFDAVVSTPFGDYQFLSPPVVGQAAMISISFTAVAPLAPGDEVVVFLQGFTCPGEGLQLHLSGPDGRSFNGSWSSSNATVSLTSRTQLPAGARQVIIDASNSLAIPKEGTGEMLFTIALNGQLGDTIARPFDSVMGIGVLSSQLSFSPAVAGQATDLLISFSLTQPLSLNSTVHLRLPGFSGNSQANLSAVSGLHASYFRASWDERNNILDLVYNTTSIAATTSFSLIIGRANGIALPAAGLVENAPELTIAVDLPPSFGATAVPIGRSDLVRVFLSSGISYLPAVAGSLTSIQLSFSIGPSGLALGEEVVFNLPSSFMGAAIPSLALLGPSSSSFAARYTAARQIILRALAPVPAGLPTSVILDASNQLFLPSAGLAGNNANNVVTIAVVSSSFPVAPTPVIDQEYVGVLSSSALAYSPARLNTPVSLWMSFALNCDLVVGDRLVLTLPGFQAASWTLSSVNVTQTPYNFSGFAKYGSLTMTVTLLAEEEVPSGSLSMLIESDKAIILPLAGVSANDPFITLRSEAINCPAPTVPVLSSPCVGFCQSALNYTSTSPGSTTGIILTFALTSAIVPGDSVRLRLPGFTGASVSLTLLGVASSYFQGSWDSSGEWATFTCVNTGLSAGSVTTLNIPSSNGIALPSSGLLPDDPSLMVETNASALTGCTPRTQTQCFYTNNSAVLMTADAARRACNLATPFSLNVTTTLCAAVTCNVTLISCSFVATTPVLSSPPIVRSVGVVDFVMSFSGTKAGTTSAVAVTLIIDTDIDVGNLLVIHLAGFSGSVSSNLLLSGPMNSSFNATWDTTSADLILKAVNSITALSTIEFTISKANGLTLPQSGLKANDTSLSIRGVTSKGVLSATPVMASTPLVPGLPMATIDYVPARIGSPTGVILNISCNMAIPAHSSLQLSLPTFRGQTSTTSTIASGNLTVIWDPLSSSLSLTPSWPISDGVVNVLLPASLGIQLPLAGHPRDWSSLAIALNISGVVVANRTLSSPCVGFCTSSLRLFLRKEGYASPMLISFTSSFAISPGDIIWLGMNGSSRSTQSTGSLALSLFNGTDFNGTWIANDDTIMLQSNRVFPAGADVGIWIDRKNLILLPNRALPTNDSGFTIGADVMGWGNSSAVTIMASDPVGIMYHSSINFSNPVAGQVTAVTVTFRSSSRILVGEAVDLELTGFFTSTGNVPSLALDTNTFQGLWNQDAQYVSLMAQVDIPQGHTTTFTMTSDNHFHLPFSGLLPNDARLRISTNCVAGPIVSVAIDESPAIGAFLSTSLSLGNNNIKPGDVANITFTFHLSGPMVAGENITLTLPGFQGVKGARQVIVNQTDAGAFLGYWDAEDTLTLTAMRYIPALATTVMIGADQGISVPAVGVYHDDWRLQVSSTAVAAPVSPVRIQSSASVGMWSSSLHFSPAVAGATSALSVMVRLLLPFQTNDTLTLRLPGFQRPANKSRSFILPSNLGELLGDWDSVGNNLTIQTMSNVDVGSTIIFTLPQSQGLVLPRVGVSAATGITVSVAFNGSRTVLTAPIWDLQPVGFFPICAVSFGPTFAGHVSSIRFNFSFTQTLEQDESMYLTLPGFVRTQGPVSVVSDRGVTFSGAWDGVDTLTLTTHARISSDSILIPASENMISPLTGIMQDDPAFTIGTDAASGPVIAQQLDSLLPIPYLADNSLSFSSTDVATAASAEAYATVLRFPSSYKSSSASIGEQFLVDDQVMTVVGVSGSNVMMKEAYTGAAVQAGGQQVRVSTPGYRPAMYSSGNDTSTLTFTYLVRQGDNASQLDIYNTTISYSTSRDWIKRRSVAPYTNVDPKLPSRGGVRSLSYNKHLIIDTSAPTVIRVTSTKRNGTYALGDIVDIRVDFSMPVVVTQHGRSGVPLMRLGIMTSNKEYRYALYDSGSGTASLTFLYIVVEGDHSWLNMRAPGLLDYYDYDRQDVSPIRTSYGGHVSSIMRMATTPQTKASLLLPQPGAFNSLSYMVAIQVDADAPRIVTVWSNLTESNLQPVYVGAGQLVHIFVRFSGDVSLDASTGSPYINLDTGEVKRRAIFVSAFNQSTLLFHYEVREGDSSPRLNYMCQCADYTGTAYMSLNGSTAPNASVVLPPLDSNFSLSGMSYIIVDTSRPTVLRVYSLTPDGQYGPGHVIDIAVQFTTSVVVMGFPRLLLSTGDALSYAEYSAGNRSDTLQFMYIVEEGDGTSDLDYSGIDALDLNGGAIKRDSTFPITGALIKLPMPGHLGSLGYSSDIIIDSHIPFITGIKTTSGPLASNPTIQTLDVFSGNDSASRTSKPFRLLYGSLVTQCFNGNVTSTVLQSSLSSLGRLAARVTELPGINGGSRFSISLDDHRSGVTQPLRVTPCWSLDDADIDSLPDSHLPLVNWGYIKPYPPGVLDIALNFSAPVAVQGRPVLEFALGDSARKADFVRGQQVQYIDIEASKQVQEGEFVLQYGEWVTDCIKWDLADALQQSSLKSRLLEIPEVATAGLRNVSGFYFGNGYRFVVSFSNPNPLPLQVPDASHLRAAGCIPFSPQDATVMVPITSIVNFRYIIQQGPRLVLTVKDLNMTRPIQSISVHIPNEDGVETPLLGTPYGMNSLAVSVMSARVPMPETFINFHALPAFLASSLSFGSKWPYAGEVSSLSFTFQLNTNITSGDALNISLPGFLGPGGLSSLVVNGSHAGAFTGTWNTKTSTISLLAVISLQAYTVVNVDVTVANQIRIPRTGVLENDPHVQIAYGGASGEVDAHPLKVTQPVGVAYAGIAYSPPQAGAISDITFTFAVSYPMLPGDTVTFQLPGFQAPRWTDRSLAISDLQAWNIPASQWSPAEGYNISTLYTIGTLAERFYADWYAVNSSVVFTATRVIPALLEAKITVLRRNKISLPPYGMNINDTRLGVSIRTQVYGNTSFRPVPKSVPVGVFQWAHSSLSKPFAGAVSAMNISFILNTDLDIGENVRVSYPKFYGCPNASLSLSGADASSFDATWEQDKSENGDWGSVVLIARNRFGNGTLVQLVVNEENYLHVADDGLPHCPYISTTASHGPVVRQEMNCTAIGHFIYSQVVIDQGSTLLNATLGLRFRFNQMITFGSGIDLRFQGLRVNLTSALQQQTVYLTGPHGRDFNAYVFASSTADVTIRLTAKNIFPEEELVNVTMGFRSGARLPLRGVMEGDPAIRIWCNSTLAPMVVEEPVMISTPVGIFFSSLAYAPRQAGAPTALTFSFTATGRILAGERLLLSLPGFSGPDTGGHYVVAEGKDGDKFHAYWNQSTSVLVLIAQRLIMPQRQSLIVPIQLGISLPSNGTRRNDVGITVTLTTMSMGLLENVPILFSDGVGAILASAFDVLTPVSGKVTQMDVAFILSGRLHTYDYVYLSLPDFSAAVDIPNVSLSGAHAGNFSGYWNEKTSTLTLKSNADMPAGPISTTIDASNMIRVPMTGYLPSHAITLATDSSETPVVPTNIKKISPVGHFMRSTVSFAPSQEKAPVMTMEALWIIFGFHLNCALKVGDTVTYTMPDLTGPALRYNLTLYGSSAGLFYGIWNASSQTVAFQATQRLMPGPYRMVVAPEGGLALPSSGYYRNDPKVMISTNASDGPVLPLPVISTQPVGFVASELRISPRRPGGPVRLEVDTMLTVDLMPSESLLLYFPSFSARDSNAIQLLGRFNLSFQASWSNVTSILNVTVTRNVIPSYTPISLGISSSNGITPPSIGVPAGDTMRLGTNARSIIPGNRTLWTNYQSVSVFGTLSPLGILFSPSVAGDTCSISLNFTLSCDLVAGDALFYHIPEMEYDPAGTEAVTLMIVDVEGYTAPHIPFTLTFDPGESVLVLTAVSTVIQGKVHVRIGAENGLRLPVHGIESNDPRLQAWSNASGCPVIAQTFDSVQAVGAFIESGILYSPQLQADVNITAYFNITSNLAVADTVTFTLPGFTGPSGVMLACEGSLASRFQVSWNTTTEKLVFIALQDIKAYTLVNLTVTSANQLQLPSTGLRLADPSLRVAFSARDAYVDDAQVINSPGIGILRSSVDLLPLVAGQPSEITLRAQLSHPLAVGDTLLFQLPGFSGPTSSNNLTMMGHAAYRSFKPSFNGSWDDASKLLTLTAIHVIDLQEVVAIVAAENKLSLPASGLMPTATLLVSSTSKEFGDHAAIPITEFPSFGALQSSSIELGNRVAGALTQMSLNLSYTGNLSIGDQIVIRFPGFRRSSTRPITLSGPGIQHFNYSWLTADKGIVSENFDWVESLNLEKGWIRRSSTNCILDAKTTIPRPSLLLPTMGPFVVVDGSESPFVIDIFSTTGSGPHGPGEIIDIHVRFSHPVVILGAEPTLNLDVGGPLPVSAEYLEGNETDALVFVYIIQQGHASNDLSCYDRRSLNSSGGLIVSDSAPFVVAANLTLPAYCGSLSRIKGVPTPMVVDGLTPPKVTLVTTKKATGTYGAGEVIDLLVYFSRPVVVSGSPYIIMNSGVSTNSTAVYTTGGSIQRIDIGVKEGHWLQNGGFLLQYKDQSTNCLSWNESYSIGQAVYDGLQSIPEIQVAGLAAVTVSEVGKGYRLTLNFSYDFVEALHPSASFCGGNGEDLVVAPSTEIVFRYIVQQGDMAINLDVAGTTSLKIDTGRGDSILLDSDRPMLAADLKLPIPGQANSLSGSCNISIDTTPPYVMSVSALDPSGSYSSANNLTFSVRFSLPVVVSGISLIALNLVPLGRHASYVSGSGSTALIFRYTIKFPDVSNALDYTGPDSLSLNGGSILRLSTIPFTPANLTMPWGNLSLAHRYNVSVDYKQAARVIQVASTLPDGVYGVGQEVPIIVTFSSAVTLYRGEAILLLDTGNPVFNRTTSSNASVAHFVDGSGTPHWTFLYTVKEGDNTTAVNFLGARALRLANTNTSAIDANDNHANLAMYPGAKDVRALNYSSRIALHDEQPRVLTVTTTLPNGTYGIGQVIDFEVTFTLPVSVVGQPRLQIQTFYLRPDAQAKYISGSGTLTLTFLYVTADEDWGKGLPAAESQLVDYDGVSALYALTSPNGSRILRHSTHPTTPALLWLPQQDKSTLAPYQIRVDPSPPRVIQVDLQVADGTYGVGEDIMVTVIFTYPVTVYGTPTMLMDTGPDHASRAYATYHSGNNTRFINYIYRIREGDTSEALDYVDTRFAPYNVDVAASAALAVSDYWLSARQLFPIPGQPRTMIKRTSTFPTTDADLTLPLPGEYGSLSYQRQVKVDSSPPIVLQVTTDVPDGTYGSGYVIDLFVIFSAPVIVTGTPWLWLEAGVDDRLVPYVAGNGTAKLTFRYVVQAGDKTSRLDYKSSASLLLAVDTMWKTDGAPRSTIKRLSDHPTTNADITLPPPGKPITVNSPKSLVGSGHSIAIQTANLFVVNVISGVPDGRYGVGHEIPLNITFSENVTVVGFPRLRLNVSVGFYAEYVGGSGSRILNFLYRVRKGDNTPRLGYPTRDSIILNGAVISSLEAGVDAVVTLPPPGANGSLDHDYAIEIDTTSVWVTQVRALNASGQYGAGDQLLFVVNFSSPVSLLEGAPELLLRLDKGIIARSKCFQPALGVYSGMLFCGYLVEDDQSTVLLDYYDEKSLILDHSVTLRASSVPLASVQPRLPCPGSLTSISGSVQIGIDPLPTVLTSVTSLTRDGTYGAGDRIDLLLHFSRSVEVFGKPLLYMNSAPSSAAVYVNGNGTSVLQFSMLLGPEDSTSDLDYRDTRSLVADIKVGAAIQRCCSTGSSQKVLLCLPPQGMVGNLAYGADLVVDNTVPRVTRIWTPLANGTYGPETEVPLVVEFSGDVSVCQSPQGLWPLIRMRIGDAHGVGAAIFQRQDSKRLHFIFVMKDTFPSGPVEVDGADAFICPMKACVVAVTGERANTQLPGVGLVCGEMGSSRSSIYYDGNNPLVSEVFFAGDAPKYGVAVGDVVTIGVRFSAPVRVNVTDHDRPRLALNVRSDGSALASYNHSYGLYELYFTYQVQPGDCSVALDYINIQALQGEIRRAAETNTSVVRMTLTAPGTRGSISYSKKVAVVCDAPYVEGIFPLKIPQGPEVYVEGEPVFLVVRFSQPVIVRGQPTLALFTGRNETGVAHYYPYKLIADNMMFRALPTDVIFLYKVHKDDMAKRLRHAGRHAIGLDNAAIMRAAMVPTTPADVECADPGWDDSTLGHTKGRWLADYPKKVEIFMRDLWHPEASDLRVTLTHGNATVKLLTNSLARKSFGAPYKREFTPASMARANSTMSVSQQEGIGWDYLVADSVLPNLALSAIANQSSTLFGASAERGNDGNIDGRFSFGSVVHTGVVEGGEPEPWWQLRFQNDVQEIGTIHLWGRVRESDVDEIQTVTVEAPEAPIGSFALSFTTDSNVTITTLPIFADASAVFMQSRLDELGALGRVQVTRTSSRMLVGHTWSITFVTFPAQVPRLRITQMNSTTPGIQYNTQVLRPGRARDQYGSISGSRQQFQSRLFPCYAMVFNASTVPQSLSTLDEAIKASIWSKRLTKDQQLTAVGLPPGVRGKYLRIQLEGTGYLSFAEVQVYAKSMMTMSEYEGGSRVIPRFITQPFQPEEPLMDTLKLLPAQGAWNLQIVDSFTQESIRGPDGRLRQQNGRGQIGDWVLILTDHADLVRLFYMDITGMLVDLPKYGNLYGETVTAMEGWEQFFGSPNEGPVPVGLSDRVVGSCLGIDRTGPYRHCYQNFGVGPSLSPPRSSDRALFSFLDRERIVYYRPGPNFLGIDTFTYRMMTGVSPSLMEGKITVHIRNCRGKAVPPAYDDKARALCACVRTDSSFFGAPECSEAVVAVCENADLATVFDNMCTTCYFAHWSSDCLGEVHRASLLLKERGMCTQTGSTANTYQPDCQTERFDNPPREAYITQDSPVANQDIVPLENANMGKGFMWSPLWR